MLTIAVLINGIVWFILGATVTFTAKHNSIFLSGLEQTCWGVLTLLICLVLLKSLLDAPSVFPKAGSMTGKIGVILSICGAILSIVVGVLFYMCFPSWTSVGFFQWLNILISYIGYTLFLVMIFFVASAGGAGVEDDMMTQKLNSAGQNADV